MSRKLNLETNQFAKADATHTIMRIEIKVVAHVCSPESHTQYEKGMRGTPYCAETKKFTVDIPEPFELMEACQIVAKSLLEKGRDSWGGIGVSQYPESSVNILGDSKLRPELDDLCLIVFSENNWLTTKYNVDDRYTERAYYEQQMRKFENRKKRRDELLLANGIPSCGLLKQMAPDVELYTIRWRLDCAPDGFGVNF